MVENERPKERQQCHPINEHHDGRYRHIKAGVEVSRWAQYVSVSHAEHGVGDDTQPGIDTVGDNQQQKIRFRLPVTLWRRSVKKTSTTQYYARGPNHNFYHYTISTIRRV